MPLQFVANSLARSYFGQYFGIVRGALSFFSHKLGNI